MDKVSYALGLSMANNFLGTGIRDLNVEEFAQAMKDIFEGKETKMSYDEAKQIVNNYFGKLQQEADVINKKAGEEFLALNKTKEGVITTSTGLQYQILTKGDGPIPKATDTVKCHYEGRLINGTIFDSSYKRNQPADFPVNQVIPGWVEALQLMPVGSKWRLFIPSDLAYGEHGAGDAISPNSTLIFDVELIQIL
jgi:FKBP-type peptidyl-prolyl cis-trans isomerase FklB